ncbi:lipid-A-disaccharide synthase [Nodosilinea sp. P-1105]|uniref:lipid-A-disaccharide synthase n=1 Tax=Nodosilinea sp. P-1105 TaxID=2546229 RepID=UPI00146B2848|nr:lipid-A-disaccharide synthase [Nodosilinea sp. P-1105]NMF81845.1 lipid-A-disaccharide synthase [Nodosilinea sp. P-1105]
MVPYDILILSNGPGEVSTWVRPVVKALRSQLPGSAQARISVVLSPCTNASGREADIVRGFPEVDRVQGANHFFPFLLRGKTATNWDWRPQGVVVFLGGDQVYPLVIGKRLGYRTVVYAEWEARWHRWIDRFGCMTPKVMAAVPTQSRPKCAVIGDLMADVGADATATQSIRQELGLEPGDDLVGLMPGSKKNKLSVGLPFALMVAAAMQQQRPQTKFVIPVAPMLPLATLAQLADPGQNPDIGLLQGEVLGQPAAPLATLVEADSPLPKLRTPAGLEVLLWQTHPAYDLLSQFRLCLTTVGANTAELGALGVPMIVLLPTQKLEAMKAWDGIPGMLMNLPGVGNPLARVINRLVLKRIYREGQRFAWPNIWAGREVVPELIGPLTPDQVAKQAVNYLEQPQQLEAMGQDLLAVRGKPGASDKLAAIVIEELTRA